MYFEMKKEEVYGRRRSGSPLTNNHFPYFQVVSQGLAGMGIWNDDAEGGTRTSTGLPTSPGGVLR